MLVVDLDISERYGLTLRELYDRMTIDELILRRALVVERLKR